MASHLGWNCTALVIFQAQVSISLSSYAPRWTMSQPADVQAQLDSMRTDQPMTDAERRNAGVALQRLHDRDAQVDPSSQQILELYVALRRSKGESSRINAAQLLGWQQRIKQSTSVKHTYWLVPRRNLEDCLGMLNFRFYILHYTEGQIHVSYTD